MSYFIFKQDASTPQNLAPNLGRDSVVNHNSSLKTIEKRKTKEKSTHSTNSEMGTTNPDA